MMRGVSLRICQFNDGTASFYPLTQLDTLTWHVSIFGTWR